MELTAGRKALCATGIAFAALAAGGVAYGVSAAPTATATDSVAHSSAGSVLPATGGSTVTVLSLHLPAGKYVLSGAGDLVNWGPSDYSRCKILVGSTQVAAVSTIVGSPAGAGNFGAAAFVSPFALTGGVSVGSAGADASLQCWHDSTNGSQPFVDPNASLYAHRTSSLQLNTE